MYLRQAALIYLKTAEGNDALAWIDRKGNSVTESQFAILRAAECKADTPAIPRLENHHDLVRKGVELVVEEEKSIGGQLGRPSGARFRTYERLKKYADQVKGTLFESEELLKALNDIYRYPLRQTATDTLNRQLRSGIADDNLAQLVVALRDEGRLCLIHEEEQTQEPRIICSMGLSGGQSAGQVLPVLRAGVLHIAYDDLPIIYSHVWMVRPRNRQNTHWSGPLDRWHVPSARAELFALLRGLQ